MAVDPQGGPFPPTRYSIVSAAQSRDPQERSQALELLAAAYWRPVYKYVRLKWHMDPEDARDFSQDFFVRLVEKDFLDGYDAGKGRLRTFLRTCLDRMFINQSRDAQRQKRGGGVLHVPLDFEEAEQELACATPPDSLDDYFEKEFVRTLFALAVEKLRAQCLADGNVVPFRMFERYDLADEDDRSSCSYADLAREFGVAVTDVTNYLSCVRREFRRCVLEQLRDMTGSDEEFRREAQTLLGVDPQ
jgi:RNA polymerase sigma factor (sigma-70 family)